MITIVQLKKLCTQVHTLLQNGTVQAVTTHLKNKCYWDAKDVKTKKVNVQTIKKPDTAVQMYKDGDLDTANISNTEATFKAKKK